MATATAESVIPISSAQKPERSIHQRLNAVMKEVKGVEKSSRNEHGKYNYAGHEAVTEAIRLAFVKHGIVQTVTMLDCDVLDGGAIKAKVLVTWACDDNPASCVSSQMFAVQHCQTKSGAVTAQQVGQALSYAVKNVAFKQLMLLGDPEPDSDSTEANDRRSDPPRRGSEPPAAGPEHTKAAEYLAEFGLCNTATEVSDVRAKLRKAWTEENLRVVPGLAEQIVKAAEKAMNRIKAGG